jgi:hypothetical protein
MQTPWNQHHQTLRSWVYQELRVLVRQAKISTAPSGRRSNAVSFVHQLFLSTVVTYPELWPMRREYYSNASQAMIEIWRELEAKDTSLTICFACLPEEASEWISLVESYCEQNPWKADLTRLKVLMGMGEVEVAEILDIPERSVRRQIAGLPTIGSSATVGMAAQ